MKTIKEILEHAVNSYADLPAVRYLEKKEIKECSYRELGNTVNNIRNGLYSEGFCSSHIALIGTSSLSWISAYLGITTGGNVAVPLDAGLPDEELIELLNRADAEALFLSPQKIQ
nr:AMP-binding protein [Lachnospiraceae bacterium]